MLFCNGEGRSQESKYFAEQRKMIPDYSKAIETNKCNEVHFIDKGIPRLSRAVSTDRKTKS